MNARRTLISKWMQCTPTSSCDAFVMLHCKIMRHRGFTIIELLVVVAIIAVLSAVVLVTFEDARLKSRDAKRLSDMKELEKAFALYSDSHGHYPISPSQIVLTSDDSVSTELEGEAVITNVPVDPLYDSLTYRYQTNTLGTTYTLTFCLEGAGIENYAQGCSNTITP